MSVRQQETESKPSKQFHFTLPTSVLVPRFDNEPKQLPQQVRSELKDVPPDGSCLYHCLTRLLAQSTWHPMSGLIGDAGAMREALARKFESSGDLYNTPEFGRDVKRALDLNTDAVSYEDAMPAYADQIRNPLRWGGDLELDLASSLFGVIIHRFDTPYGVPSKNKADDARLVTSFFPTSEQSDRNHTVSKWCVVFSDSHFQYVTPVRPRGLPAQGQPTAQSERIRQLESSEDVKRRGEYLRRNWDKGPKKPEKPTPNRLMAELARERMQRLEETKEQKEGGFCLPELKKLTKAQEEERLSVELARKLETMELQREEGRRMARAAGFAS